MPNLTPEQMKALIRETAQEAYEDAQTTLAAEAAARAAQRAAQMSEPDRVHALHILRAEHGLDELSAYRKLENDPQALVELQPQIERRRATVATLRSEEARREFANSPEGRQLAAAEALAAERRQAAQVAAAHALIRSDPEAHGVTLALAEELTPDQVLSVAGLVQAPADKDNDLQANIDRANGGTTQ